MALTAPQRRDAWGWLLKQDPTIGQVFDKSQVEAAALATDNWIETNQGATTSGPGYNSTLASPGFRTATAQQKTLLFCAVARARAGLI